MGICCCKKRIPSHSEESLNSKRSENVKVAIDENHEEKSLLDSVPNSPLQDTPPQTKDPEAKQIQNDASSSSSEETKLDLEKDHLPKENGLEEEHEYEDVNEGLILSHPVPMTGDRLLINELKTKFPEGLEDLKRRTRESLQSSFRRSQQKIILLPPPTQVYDSMERHPSQDLVDNLRILEEKLRNTQKIIVNNTELSMTNILEQFKLDLANMETSLQPIVIDKRREVYCKLKACFGLSATQEKPKLLESYGDDVKDVKKTSALLRLESLNQQLTELNLNIEENENILETQKQIEDILVSLENIRTRLQEELILKNYLREKSLYLIKECILKYMR